MKKLVSVVLALTMVVSMLATASAATIGEMITSTDDPFLELTLPVSVLGRRSGTGNYGTSLSILDGLNESVAVDYKATLDMAQVRGLFDKNFVTAALADSAAKAEFEAGTVSTEVKVTVEYTGATVANASTAGSLTSGNQIFEEKGVRTVSANKVEITYKNQDGITVSELLKNKNKYLADVVFELSGVNAAKYGAEGTNNVKVTIDGRSEITFTSKTVAVEYDGSGSFVISTTKEHVLEVVPAVPATCTADGFTEGVKCKTHDSYECGTKGTREPQTTTALGHDTMHVNKVDATCMNEGTKEHYFCKRCKKTYSDNAAQNQLTDLVISQISHNNTPIPEDAATCTADGWTAGEKCSVCGTVSGRKRIPATGHTKSTIAKVDATCTADGSTDGVKCSTCGTVLVAPIKIAAKGHTYKDNWTVTTPATEGAEGVKERVCEDCGEGKQTVTIPKLQHTCVADPKAAVIVETATCTKKGSKQNYCACGNAVGEAEEIPALGHSAEKVVGRAATCVEVGIAEHYACSRCRETFRDEQCTVKLSRVALPIDKNNHAEAPIVKIPAVKPTCNTDGLTEGEKCSKCNTVTKAQTKVNKLRDNPANFATIPYKAPTCEASGVVAHLHCSICGENYTLDAKTVIENDDCTIPALGHAWDETVVITEPTETAEGEGYKICKNNPNHKDDLTIAKKEHVHNETCEEVVKAPTCTEKGKKVVRYICCGEIKKDAPGADANGYIEVPANGHTYMTVEKEPDCYNEGVKKHYYCTVCGKKFDFSTGSPITDESTLKRDKLTHEFEEYPGPDSENYTYKKCKHCDEVVMFKKENKGTVTDHGGIKSDVDKAKEDIAASDTDKNVTVESEITIDERALSEELEEEIQKDEKAQEEKYVLEITIEKITTATDNSDNVIGLDKEVVPETNDIVTIEIPIPEEMRTMVDFIVHRLHRTGSTNVIEALKKIPNADGEYIEIAGDKTKITLHVKKFSEYAIVGYNEVVNTPVTSGGGGSSTYIVRFNANGGTAIEAVKVRKGAKVDLPTPQRDGYVFAGWFTDSALTKKFDSESAVNSNLVLYAKWISVGECDGINGCPHNDFDDISSSMWYHRGIDFVLNKGLMIGIADRQFAPDMNVTRAMLVTVLWRNEGRPSSEKSAFDDLEKDSYYEGAVDWAVKNGIVTGHSEKVFAPNDAITREQFAAIMHRYAVYKKYDVSVGENTNILSYTDYSDIAEYAIGAMQYAAGSGLMTGRTESTLNPKDNATRAEMATILQRFMTENN